MFFAVHELTHKIKNDNAESYAALRDFVTERLNGSEDYKGLSFAGNTLAERIQSAREQYAARGKELSQEDALDEIIADAIPVILSDRSTVQDFVRMDRTLAERIRDFFDDFYTNLQNTINNLVYGNGQKLEYAALSKDRDAVKAISDMFREALEGENEGVRDDIERYAMKAKSNDSSVAQQIIDNTDTIASQPIAAIINARSRSGLTVSDQKRIAKKELAKYGSRIDRKDFGIVEFGNNEIDSSFAYINGDAEYSALFAVPQIIKKGIQLPSGHKNHKGRGFSTVTFAGRVKVGTQEGVMAVVVKEMSKNRYKMLRILTPAGTSLRIEGQKTEPTTGGGSYQDKMPSPISSAFDNSILTETEKSNQEAQEIADTDVNLSLRTEQGKPSKQLSIDDTPEELDRIRTALADAEKENESLRGMVDSLQEQFKLSKGYRPNEKALKRVTRGILKEYVSKYDAGTLTDELRELYDFASTEKDFDGGEVMARAMDIAKRVLAASSELDTSLLSNVNKNSTPD